ncbi:MAG: hypothetical protein GX940_08400 [Clostridiaceae bacterium]|nr:hypothetical protein [Clostridiaceae bacterium]
MGGRSGRHQTGKRYITQEPDRREADQAGDKQAGDRSDREQYRQGTDQA